MSKWRARISIKDFDAKIKLNTNNEDNVYDKLYTKISDFLNELTDNENDVEFDVNLIEEMKCENCGAFCIGTRNPDTGWCMDEELEVDKNGYCCAFH